MAELREARAPFLPDGGKTSESADEDKTKKRVAKIMHGPIESHDRIGLLVNRFFQFAVVSFIVIIILETDKVDSFWFSSIQFQLYFL